MADNREKNFVSAVVYLQNDRDRVEAFFSRLDGLLARHFEHYELIAVNDGCTDGSEEALKKWAAQKLDAPLTVINMSLRQGVEAAMNAGLDAAIGDFVFEFDSIEAEYPIELVWEAYAKSLTGYDIVNVCPSRAKASSRFFYWVFNRFHDSIYPLQTDVFRVVSRRAINRVHLISSGLAYRKASYAASGLACASITFEGKASVKDSAKRDKAMDSLVLYTDAGYKLSLFVSVAMLLLTVVAAIYTVTIWATGSPIAGWTTTMLVLSAGLSGLFFILTVVVKYLNILVRLVFKKQSYLIEGIDKIQK